MYISWNYSLVYSRLPFVHTHLATFSRDASAHILYIYIYITNYAIDIVIFSLFLILFFFLSSPPFLFSHFVISFLKFRCPPTVVIYLCSCFACKYLEYFITALSASGFLFSPRLSPPPPSLTLASFHASTSCAVNATHTHTPFTYAYNNSTCRAILTHLSCPAERENESNRGGEEK